MVRTSRSAPSRIATSVTRLRNIADVKGPLRRGTLLHFSAEQWQQAIKGLPAGRAVPKYGVGLEGYPIPGGDVIAQPICIQNPCEICRARVTGFGPDGAMAFECVCRPDPDCPRQPPPPPPSPLCALAVRSVRGTLQLVCESRGCQRRCQMAVVRQNGRYLIVCRCA